MSIFVRPRGLFSSVWLSIEFSGNSKPDIGSGLFPAHRGNCVTLSVRLLVFCPPVSRFIEPLAFSTPRGANPKRAIQSGPALRQLGQDSFVPLQPSRFGQGLLRAASRKSGKAHDALPMQA